MKMFEDMTAISFILYGGIAVLFGVLVGTSNFESGADPATAVVTGILYALTLFALNMAFHHFWLWVFSKKKRKGSGSKIPQELDAMLERLQNLPGVKVTSYQFNERDAGLAHAATLAHVMLAKAMAQIEKHGYDEEAFRKADIEVDLEWLTKLAAGFMVLYTHLVTTDEGFKSSMDGALKILIEGLRADAPDSRAAKAFMANASEIQVLHEMPKKTQEGFLKRNVAMTIDTYGGLQKLMRDVEGGKRKASKIDPEKLKEHFKEMGLPDELADTVATSIEEEQKKEKRKKAKKDKAKDKDEPVVVEFEPDEVTKDGWEVKARGKKAVNDDK